MTPLDLNGKTVLVTGGAGFIGSNLALAIERHNPRCRVIVADSFASGHFQNLRGFAAAAAGFGRVRAMTNGRDLYAAASKARQHVPCHALVISARVLAAADP